MPVSADEAVEQKNFEWTVLNCMSYKRFFLKNRSILRTKQPPPLQWILLKYEYEGRGNANVSCPRKLPKLSADWRGAERVGQRLFNYIDDNAEINKL